MSSLRNVRVVYWALAFASIIFATKPAAAACSSSADFLTLNCSGTLTTSSGLPITIYDAAAAFQPIDGSNSYVPANPAFPAASYPNTPGYNPNPPTVTVNFNGATFNVMNPTSAQLADGALVVANYSNNEAPSGVNNVVVNIDALSTLAMSTNSFGTRIDLIKADSQVNNFTVNNNGNVSVTQTAFGSFSTSNLNLSCTGTPASCTAKYSGSTLNDVATFYSDDNTNEFVLNNAAGAFVTANGNFATAYYGRADTTITNYGTIQNTTWLAGEALATGLQNGAWSIATWAGTDFEALPGTNPDSPDNVVSNLTESGGVWSGTIAIAPGGTSATTITNYGTITGDILALDTTPLVVAAGEAKGIAGPYSIGGTNAGPRDSNIENYGLINGNFYLGSGTHVIDNAAGATINGGFSVNQAPAIATFSVANIYSTNPSLNDTPLNGEPAANQQYYSSGGTYNQTGQTGGMGDTGYDYAGNQCPAAGSATPDAGCAATTKVLASYIGGQSFTLTNEGTLNGDIIINDQPTSVNSITLTGSGFSGNVVAVNGTGSNSLTLNGVTNLASVYQFSSLDLGTSQVTVTPNSTTNSAQQGVTLVSGATLATTISGNGQAGSLNFTGGGAGNSLNLQGPTTIVPVFAGIVHNGESYQISNSVSGDTADITIQNTSALVSFTDPAPGIILTGTVMSPYQVPGISNPGAATLTNLLSYSGGNPQLQGLGAAVESLTSLDQVRNAGEQLRPSVNGGTVQVPIDIAYAFQSQIDSRLQSNLYGALARDEGWYADADLPVTKPSSTSTENGGWINALNADDRQQTTAGVSGYDAHSGGLIGGYDHLFNNVLRLGGAVGYVTSAINDSVIFGNRQDLKTYEGIAYGSFVQPKWYVDASAGAGGLAYNSFRTVNFPGFFDTDTANYNGMLYSARFDGGYPVRLPFGVVIPVAGVTYAHVEQNAYTESSQNGSGLTVAQQNTNSVRSSLGLKAVVPVSVGSVFTLSVEPHAVWLHEFENTGQIVSAGFVGGSGTFLAIGPTPTREMGDVGAALRFSQPQFGDSLALSYDAIVRNAYLDQVAMLHARVDF